MKRNIIFSCLIIISFSAYPQSKMEYFKKLERPVKWWVITHPFIASKAFHISQQALSVEKEVKESGKLDTFSYGGQLDAFRHGYWMASLSKETSSNKARKLGKAYERGNYLQYKRRVGSGHSVPDMRSSEMDLWNNEIGICIGKCNRYLSQEEIQNLVIDYILSGKMLILRMDANGNFLNRNEEILTAEELNNQWNNQKDLVPSNYWQIRKIINIQESE
jgi:hypothetical protein